MAELHCLARGRFSERPRLKFPVTDFSGLVFATAQWPAFEF